MLADIGFAPMRTKSAAEADATKPMTIATAMTQDEKRIDITSNGLLLCLPTSVLGMDKLLTPTRLGFNLEPALSGSLLRGTRMQCHVAKGQKEQRGAGGGTVGSLGVVQLGGERGEAPRQFLVARELARSQ